MKGRFMAIDLQPPFYASARLKEKTPDQAAFPAVISLRYACRVGALCNGSRKLRIGKKDPPDPKHCLPNRGEFEILSGKSSACS